MKSLNHISIGDIEKKIKYLLVFSNAHRKSKTMHTENRKSKKSVNTENRKKS